MPTSSKGRIRKCLQNRRKMRRAEVLKILAAAMEKSTTASTSSGVPAGDQATATGTKSSDYHSEFYNTGRVGRRNAMPDILGNHSTTSTADLPEQLSALTTDDTSSGAGASGASTSGTNPTPSTSAS